ncbi:MAG: c-type cytochrome [Steroidobacteraceae bacterium]
MRSPDSRRSGSQRLVFAKGPGARPRPALLAAASCVLWLVTGCSGSGRGHAQASTGRPTGTGASSPSRAASSGRCPQSDAGLKLPAGFCASIFADNIGHARHMVVAPNGVLYVNTWSGRYYPNSAPPAGGFLVALRDTAGQGKANVFDRFGPTPDAGGHGGTGIGLYGGYLYAENNDTIVRYALPSGSMLPTGPEQVVVSGLPLTGDHPMHPFAIDADGWIYVDVATPTNACQERNRMLRSPGIDPCRELKTRGGIWRYSAKETGQKFSPAQRYATGIRNAEGLVIDPSGHGLYYATQHGRDQLGQNWPDHFTPEEGAYLPAEELVHVVEGGDYGWPYCFYDGVQRKLVLAPEYGGDGKKVGRCARKRGPVAAFPAHWAPNDLLVYDGKQFPERYRGGAFIAFHGSWNRAPFPQQGYDVVFQPLSDGKATGNCEIFADGFAAGEKGPGAAHRPSGLAVGSDGALYVADDVAGRIYRIVYRGGEAPGSGAGVTPCPSMTALNGGAGGASAAPPEGTNANAGATGAPGAAGTAGAAGAVASLPVPPGASRQRLEQGARIYRGQVASATCTGCHGTEGQGTPLGPDLRSGHWVWSNGSLAGIEKTIREGVAKPKSYRSPMPPMGGSQLTRPQVRALAAYVWALSHRGR